MLEVEGSLCCRRLGVFSVCDLCAVGMLLFDPGCLEPEGSGRGAGRNWRSGGNKGSTSGVGLQTDLFILPVLCP